MPLLKTDMQQISPDIWSLFQDSHGRVLDEYSVRKWAFYKGISPEARTEVWKFLLGYYPFLSTNEERVQIDKEKRRKYEELLESWQQNEVTPRSELANYIRVISKDCVRTDRCHTSFSGDGQEATENINTLKRILTAFVVYNPTLGYVQGMNEYLSPIYLVVGSEHQSFWCLTEVLGRMTDIFSDLTLSQPLATLSRLSYYADTKLHNHISRVHGQENDWIFCYRGVLLNFKREFPLDDVFSLWEIIWSNHLTKYFQLFVAVAILVHLKQELLVCNTMECFMEFAMSFSVPLPPVLTIARAMAEQLKGDEYCPYELRYLVSDVGCSPPPLVGFVRTRQRFTTLQSNKTLRNDIWTTLFGEPFAEPIMSPFLLSSTSNPSSARNRMPAHLSALSSPDSLSNRSKVNEFDRIGTEKSAGAESNCVSPPVSAPPKFGFVPRSSNPSSDVSQRSFHMWSSNKSPTNSPQHVAPITTTPWDSQHPQSPLTPPTFSTSTESHSTGFINGQACVVGSSNSYGNQATVNLASKRLTSNSRGGVDTSSEVAIGSRIGLSGNAVHFNNHTEKLSGGIFDDEKVVLGEEVFCSSEFDSLRTEATLDIQ